MSDTNNFEIDGTKFRQSPLKLKPSLKAEAILINAALPAMAAGYSLRQGLSAEAIGSLVSGLERVEELVEIFASVCKHERGGSFVELRPFLDPVFERRNAALLAWLIECVAWQFADFFDGSGFRLLEEKASRFVSLLGSTGESGE